MKCKCNNEMNFIDSDEYATDTYWCQKCYTLYQSYFSMEKPRIRCEQWFEPENLKLQREGVKVDEM